MTQTFVLLNSLDICCPVQWHVAASWGQWHILLREFWVGSVLDKKRVRKPKSSRLCSSSCKEEMPHPLLLLLSHSFVPFYTLSLLVLLSHYFLHVVITDVVTVPFLLPFLHVVITGVTVPLLFTCCYYCCCYCPIPSSLFTRCHYWCYCPITFYMLLLLMLLLSHSFFPFYTLSLLVLLSHYFLHVVITDVVTVPFLLPFLHVVITDVAVPVSFFSLVVVSVWL